MERAPAPKPNQAEVEEGPGLESGSRAGAWEPEKKAHRWEVELVFLLIFGIRNEIKKAHSPGRVTGFGA